MKKMVLLLAFFTPVILCFAQENAVDTVKIKIYAEKMYYDFSGQYRIDLDSTLTHFEIFNPAFQNFTLNQYLGNAGSAVLPLTAQDNAGSYDLIFNKYIKYNFYKPEDIAYFNTKAAFTNLTYLSAGPKSRQEQGLFITHTQNVNKYLNVGFLGHLTYSDGEFANQLIKGNSFSLFSSYSGQGRYSYNFNVNLSKLKTTENGGLYSDQLYEENTDYASYTIPVALQDAYSLNKSLTFFLQHKFSLTGSYPKDEDSVKLSSRWNDAISIVHRMKYERSARSYHDDLSAYDSYSTDVDHYPSVNMDSTTTRDSSYFRQFENTLMLSINAWPVIHVPAELRFGIKNQLDKTGYMKADSFYVDTTLNTSRYVTSTYINSALAGSLTNRFSKTVTWGASAELYFTGYKAGNVYLAGDISKTIKNNFLMALKGNFSFEKTPYFLKNYESNHFIWHTSFSNQSNTILHATISHSKLKLTLEGESGSYINFIYFDSVAMPRTIDLLTMYRLSLKKYFDLGFFHTMFKGTIQQSTDDRAMPLPVFCGFNSTYIEFVYSKVMLVQIGFDAFYNSDFYAKAYQPALGMYYSQRTSLYGNSAYADAFINVKLKRCRAFFKYDNLGSLINAIPKYYFSPHYPYNPGILKFGLSWQFYD